MDFCSYVNSKAIGDHLRDINYEFNTKEAAWLIYQCKSISVQEKHEAWEKLIREFPDYPVDISKECCEGNSIYELIRGYIAVDEKRYEDFKRQKAGAVYQYRFYCAGDCGWCEDFDGVYGSLEECWKKIDEEKNLDIEIVQIKKKYISSNREICVIYRPDKTVMNIDTNCLTDEECDVIGRGFDDFWFDFPVPFEKGDILLERCIPGPRIYYAESGPFVLDGITPWDVERNKSRKQGMYGDSTDMNAWGYFQDDDGRIFHEVMFNYMDLDYCEASFEGPHRLLVALSNYLKGKIGLDLLLTAYRKVILDEAADDVMLHGWYTEEGLMQAGLNDVIAGNNKHRVDSGLNTNITFFKRYYSDTEYDWSKNQELYDKCHEIASNYYQPKEMLYVYGEHGCGKTTILQSLGNLSLDLSIRNLLYTTAENFVKETIDAIRSSKPDVMSKFREKYRNLDFLIFEDIQFLCGKESCTEEFTAILNDLLTAGAQVVISSDRPLQELDLPNRLKNKLSFATQMRMYNP